MEKAVVELVYKFDEKQGASRKYCLSNGGDYRFVFC